MILSQNVTIWQLKKDLSFRKTKEVGECGFQKEQEVKKCAKKGRITFEIVVELSDQAKPCQTRTEVILHVTFYHRNVQNETGNSQLFRKDSLQEKEYCNPLQSSGSSAIMVSGV